MKTKINIGIALSRNYDKISLEFLEEEIEHESEEQLKFAIQQKFEFIKKSVKEQFDEKQEKPQTKPTSPQKDDLKATDKQKKFLKDLGFEGNLENLSKLEAKQLIEELLNKPTDY